MRAKERSLIQFFVITLLLLCNLTNSYPMLYKKNIDDVYEADLVPISSTVIPLTVLEISYGVGGKPSEEYKEAYLKKLRKKAQNIITEHQGDIMTEPDTLITVKSQNRINYEKANIKTILI